jgi:hypothetical protein
MIWATLSTKQPSKKGSRSGSNRSTCLTSAKPSQYHQKITNTDTFKKTKDMLRKKVKKIDDFTSH